MIKIKIIFSSIQQKKSQSFFNIRFEGENVAHVDGETQTDDWRQEFGPSQTDTYASICSEHPHNDWCKVHGYGAAFHAAATRTTTFSSVSSFVISMIATTVVASASTAVFVAGSF